MARKKGMGALWKTLGLTPQYSASGKSIKGYTDAEGNYYSERQYRQKFTNAPMKGSRKPKTAEEKITRQINAAWNQIETAAKTPGMTLKQFMTGKEPTPPSGRNLSQHNNFVDAYRRDAINFKKMAGVMDKAAAKSALTNLEQEIKWRDKLLDLNEKLKSGDYKGEARRKLAKEYMQASKRYREAHSKLLGKGIMSEEDEPGKDSLRYMYYHS
jgi:hypothetical protein